MKRCEPHLFILRWGNVDIVVLLGGWRVEISEGVHLVNGGFFIRMSGYQISFDDVDSLGVKINKSRGIRSTAKSFNAYTAGASKHI
ncbi:hypothetical protein SDC9_81560 [bioreactor metagenome]|uniref:Uncharacterized protein n=1 Tax=bioreactor metagenome TaxID=1076179 RepID=A0A644Z275_9ZZZZ